MLTLGIKPGDYVVIGKGIVIQAVEQGGQLRLSIDAPKHVSILRSALYEQENPTPECILRARPRNLSAV